MVAGAFVLTAVALSVFQLVTAGVRPVGLFYQRGFHLAAVEILAVLVFPARLRRGEGALADLCRFARDAGKLDRDRNNFV